MRPKIALTFSSGRSSATMVDRFLNEYSANFDFQICFANTGWEHPESLEFAKKCDDHWGGIVTWLEAVVHPGLKSSTHKIVTYETASRNQEPFKAVIEKYGIPNKGYPHCTRELKENVIISYLKSLGWKNGTYPTAIGIRGDEPKRLNRGLNKSNGQYRIYPLADWFYMSKQEVLDYWKRKPFDLGIPEHFGNCEGCYRKSASKLELVYLEKPQAFDFALNMEQAYGKVGKNKIRGVYVDEPRQFYRGEISAKDMIANFKLKQVQTAA